MVFVNQIDLFISEIRRILVFTSGYYFDCTFGLGIISRYIYNFMVACDKLFIYEKNAIYCNSSVGVYGVNVFFYNVSNLRVLDLKLENCITFAVVDIGYCDSEILNKRSLLNFLSYSGSLSVAEALNFFSSSYLADILCTFGSCVLKTKLLARLCVLRASPVIYNTSFMVACGNDYYCFRKFIDIVSRYTSAELIGLRTLLLNLFSLLRKGAYVIFICFNSQETMVVDQFVRRHLFEISYFRTFSVSFRSNFTMSFMKVLKKKCL
ncbi:hypothetical protein JSR02_00665 [Candidatus Vidania fulgoroideae]|uniref:Uncharacterized protein n=1 Tax=Candidatus Vidania fulgoroideorum TaxID=881286 RepID=A0A974X756_9PROT|nr:hypothetical protein JSR02_00665 [Candidatus Vidania fulgoroideae]